MNLAQQLDSGLQPVGLASPETLPTHASSFSGTLRLPFPFPWQVEEENEEAPLERNNITCVEVEESFWAAYWV